MSIHSLFIAKVERKKFFSKKVFEANREREDGEKKIRTEEAAGGENDHFQDTNLKVFFQFWVIYVGWLNDGGDFASNWSANRHYIHMMMVVRHQNTINNTHRKSPRKIHRMNLSKQSI